MGIFASKSPALLGVDISSTAVRLLELGRSGSHYRVEHYASEPLPTNSVVEKGIVEVEAVGEAIRQALARSGSKLKNAAAAVAGSAVITKVITMPAELSEDELEDQIQVEANQYIPYPIDEVSLDFEVIGPVHGNPDLNNILLAASRTENVDMRVAALGLAGLTAKVIDVEAFAMENAFRLLRSGNVAGSDSLVALVDIGETMTTLAVLRGQRTLYSREQIFGGRQLTDDIMRRYGLARDEAARAKIDGGLPDEYEAEALTPFRETVAQQVGRLLQFFYASGEYDKVDELLLAGGCAAIDGLPQLISEHLDLPCRVADPLAGMSLPSALRARVTRDAPALMIATGLAMRSFD